MSSHHSPCPGVPAKGRCGAATNPPLSLDPASSAGPGQLRYWCHSRPWLLRGSGLQGHWRPAIPSHRCNAALRDMPSRLSGAKTPSRQTWASTEHSGRLNGQPSPVRRRFRPPRSGGSRARFGIRTSPEMMPICNQAISVACILLLGIGTRAPPFVQVCHGPGMKH